MAKPNTTFELSVEDLEMIEDALRDHTLRLAESARDGSSCRRRSVHDLLGRLHNQKVFYRPRGGGYVGG
ncbi:hypothetical protein [Pseudaestuariivita atlantica]|uniref:Uncharacterized protein n=1 Tax=Pseudaestuariivita atlantica TaxID=1317121 RepID=A0A0L1JRR5_9RHOB|nr:hypothetical protein [Pseudaestuariivita atlantica]KNG94417.1 hypothetical protein ATO11_07000 [Pseudaestuariivita atlantica]